jgi:hypothetical protein
MPYTKYVQNSIDYHQREIDNLKSLEGTARVVEGLRAGLADDLVFDVDTYGSDQIKMTLKPKSVQQLAVAMRTFRGHGLRIEKVEDHPESQKRTYYVGYVEESKNKYPRGTHMRQNYPAVRVDAFFNAEDGECKYVQIDTETKVIPATEEKVIEKPVYELQCGGETAEVLV